MSFDYPKAFDAVNKVYVDYAKDPSEEKFTLFLQQVLNHFYGIKPGSGIDPKYRVDLSEVSGRCNEMLLDLHLPKGETFMWCFKVAKYAGPDFVSFMLHVFNLINIYLQARINLFYISSLPEEDQFDVTLQYLAFENKRFQEFCDSYCAVSTAVTGFMDFMGDVSGISFEEMTEAYECGSLVEALRKRMEALMRQNSSKEAAAQRVESLCSYSDDASVESSVDGFGIADGFVNSPSISPARVPQRGLRPATPTDFFSPRSVQKGGVKVYDQVSIDDPDFDNGLDALVNGVIGRAYPDSSTAGDSSSDEGCAVVPVEKGECADSMAMPEVPATPPRSARRRKAPVSPARAHASPGRRCRH